MKKIISLLIISALYSLVNAQSVPIVSPPINPTGNNLQTYAAGSPIFINGKEGVSVDLASCLDNSNNFEDIHPDINGYPFLVPNWVKGSVDIQDKGISDYNKMNFCFYNQQIWFKEGNKTMVLPYNEKINKITLDEKIFVYRVLPKDEKWAPVEQLVSGKKVSLFKVYSATFTAPQKAGSSYENAKKAKFTNSYDFYCSFDNKTLIISPSKKNDFLKLFSDNSKEMEEFISKQKIKLNKEVDLIKVINFYNSIQ